MLINWMGCKFDFNDGPSGFFRRCEENGITVGYRYNTGFQFNKLSSGFPERNLYEMRQFYLVHKIWPAPAELSLPIIEFGRRLPN